MCGRQWRRILNSIDITIKYTGALEDIGVILQKYTSAIQNRRMAENIDASQVKRNVHKIYRCKCTVI